MGPISKKLIARLIVLGLATSVGAFGIAVSTADLALAGGKGGGGGKGPGGGGGGGGGGHGWGGGGGGHWSGGGGASHFSAARFSGGHPISASHYSHVSHWSGGHHYSYSHVTHYSHTHTTGIHTHSNLSKSNVSKSNLNHANTTEHALKNAGQEKNNANNLNEHVKPLKNASDPKNFGARRDFATKTAFNSFWHDKWHQDWWHHHHFFHIGWIGPLFWPYAYGDFFYFALWPWDYWYYDPFWAYGYGDIYEAVFFPYSYEDYVQGPRAPDRMARLKQGIVQSCNEEAGEVTGWPIDQIQAAVQPDQHQSQLLDDLGNAIVKASDEIRAHCQNDISFTPTGRLDQMHARLQGLVDGVNIVSPALSSFYNSLNDEQKARFDQIAPRAPRRGQTPQTDLTRLNIRNQCDAGMMAWPTDQIDRAVRPDDAQRAKLQSLQSAASQAADAIKAACPADVPSTPPARLAAVGQRLQAMLQGVETMQPALADFYNSLSDDREKTILPIRHSLFTIRFLMKQRGKFRPQLGA
jgi:LTXXQ motif family protein